MVWNIREHTWVDGVAQLPADNGGLFIVENTEWRPVSLVAVLDYSLPRLITSHQSYITISTAI